MSEPTRSIYVIGTGRNGVVKIGIASSPVKRLSSIQTGSPERLSILATFPGDAALERRLHEHFAARRVSGEWFDFGDLDTATEVAAVIEAPPKFVAVLSELEQDEDVLRRVQAVFGDEAFLPTRAILQKLPAQDLTLREASMRLASALARFGVRHTRGYVDGRQCWGYRRVELDRLSV